MRSTLERLRDAVDSRIEAMGGVRYIRRPRPIPISSAVPPLACVTTRTVPGGPV